MKKTDDLERILVRVSEAADILSIARSNAYVLVKSGHIPSVRIGRSLRVPVAELRKLVDQQIAHA